MNVPAITAEPKSTFLQVEICLYSDLDDSVLTQDKKIQMSNSVENV